MMMALRCMLWLSDNIHCGVVRHYNTMSVTCCESQNTSNGISTRLLNHGVVYSLNVYINSFFHTAEARFLFSVQ